MLRRNANQIPKGTPAQDISESPGSPTQRGQLTKHIVGARQMSQLARNLQLDGKHTLNLLERQLTIPQMSSPLRAKETCKNTPVSLELLVSLH